MNYILLSLIPCIDHKNTICDSKFFSNRFYRASYSSQIIYSISFTYQWFKVSQEDLRSTYGNGIEQL